MRAATVAFFAAVIIAVGGLAALSGLACDTTVHQPLDEQLDGTVTSTCLEASQHSDYEWISKNVFDLHCSLSNVCHASNRAAANLNLKKDRALGDLIDVQAESVPDWLRVVRFHPEQSYLLVKMGAIDGPLGDGGLMPQGSGGRLLCQQKLDAVRRWIEQGAFAEVPSDAGPDAAPDASADGPVDAGGPD